MKHIKLPIVSLLSLLTFSVGYINAQNKEIPLFTEFRTAEEDENEEWNCKITNEKELGCYMLQLVSSKEKTAYNSQWVCVQVLDKPTRQLVQKIELNTSGRGDSFDIEDYNFDGHDDFSLLGGCGTLDNFYSYYFLFDTETKTFIESGFEGTNLVFDGSSKTITSRNRSRAGASVASQTYKLVDNQMILIEQQCLEAMRDEATGNVLFNEDNEIVFEEVDCHTHYLDMQLQSVGLTTNFKLRMAVYDENIAGGFVFYKGQAERIPIHYDREEVVEDRSGEGRPNTRQLFYNEIYQGEVNGVYVLTIQGAVCYDVRYIRGKDGRTFDLKIISQ